MSSLQKYTFRMTIMKHDLTADKAFYATTLTEAMKLVHEDIVKVIKDTTDKIKREGRKPLTLSDFKVELLDEQKANWKH